MSINKPDEAVTRPDVDPASANSTTAGFNEHRRRLAKFAVGAPVLVTLASRPVFGAQCLSNMLSGNTSPGHSQGNCTLGSSPGGIGEPGGTIQGYSGVTAWNAINWTYGTLVDTQHPNKYDSYSGGATMAFISALPDRGHLLNPDGVLGTTLVREMLTDKPGRNDSQRTRHLVCAYFNALLSALPNSSFHYVLTPQQVLDLAGGAPLPKPWTDLQKFLGSTWN